MNLLLVKKMAIKSIKKNPIAKDLYTKKYKPKIVKPKKGKGSYKREQTDHCETSHWKRVNRQV